MDGLAALAVAAKRLREVDPAKFKRVVALVRTYVAAYDRPNEADEVFASRLREIGQKPDLYS